jgi:ubiquinone/menaquinone biosynthesis C-methylase UbiE
MVTRSEMPQFHELAEYYDAINDWKNYQTESLRLESIARRWGRPGKTSWLDVACGTGRHLEYLRQRHPVVGVDASREMLRIAGRRLPGVPLYRGDMRTFELHRQFDVVSCLFGAIGHIRTKADVRRTFENFARHLKPGGIAIVESWIESSAFRPGMIHLRTYESTASTIARVAHSSRRGNRSLVHYHFLIGTPGRDVRYFEHRDEGLLLSREELLQLMRSAGLTSRFLARGFTPSRGLLIGVKPGAK